MIRALRETLLGNSCGALFLSDGIPLDLNIPKNGENF